MRRKLMSAILLVTLIEVSCATTAPYNPFHIDRGEFYSKIKTIALAPIEVPEFLGDPEPVRSKFQPLIEAKLHESGFSMVPVQEYVEIWERTKKQIGPFFDPLTGKRDNSKFKAAMEQTFRELSTKFNADVVLYPVIGVVKADFEGNIARWHGTSEKIIPAGFWESVKAGFYNGTISALSLIISIKDIHGIDMYLNRGGIQLLQKLSKNKFIPVPREELFTNEEQNVKAVNITLDPLIERGNTLIEREYKGIISP